MFTFKFHLQDKVNLAELLFLSKSHAFTVNLQCASKKWRLNLYLKKFVFALLLLLRLIFMIIASVIVIVPSLGAQTVEKRLRNSIYRSVAFIVVIDLLTIETLCNRLNFFPFPTKVKNNIKRNRLVALINCSDTKGKFCESLFVWNMHWSLCRWQTHRLKPIFNT